MSKKKTAPIPQDIKLVLQQFKRWRETKPSSRAIPEQLWQSAVSLAQKYSVSKIHSLLHLDYTKLKRLVSQAQSQAQDVIVHTQAQFVSIPPMFPTKECSPTVIELSSTDGRSLVIRTHQPLDLDALIHSF